MPLQNAALEIAENHHLWIDTIGAVDPLCCGHAYTLLYIMLTGVSILQNIADC